MNLSHVPCTAHKLNLIVQQSLLLSDNEDTEPNTNANESDLKNLLKKVSSHCWIF